MTSYKEMGESPKTSKAHSIKNALQDVPWILKQIVQEDLAQRRQILGEDFHSNTLTYAQLYGQRFIEIGYIFTEVFLRDEYKNWQPESESPRIIDLGGDPGAISALYWKYRAPNAQVTVVEANPATANVMRKSLIRRGHGDIQIINAAVAGNNGNTHLHLHKPGKGWHTQDFIGQRSLELGRNEFLVEVPKIKLSDLIDWDEQIDLLKIDIEGLEGEVMHDLEESGKLSLVKQVIMEFHYGSNDFPGNSITEMLNLLKNNNFRITESHVTSGTGLRTKKEIDPMNLPKIAKSKEKKFITLNAVRDR